MMSSSLRAVVVGNATIAAIAATAMITAKVLNSTGPPKAAMRLGVVPRKTIANTPSAIPTMAKSRCGLALWAIVPWVKLSAQPIATPATKCSTARGAKSETNAAARNARHASAKPAVAAVRESIRLKRGAKNKAANHRANQKQRREAARLLRGEMILRDQRADPYWQGDKVDHAGAMSEHQRDAAAWPCSPCLVLHRHFLPSFAAHVQIGAPPAPSSNSA